MLGIARRWKGERKRLGEKDLTLGIIWMKGRHEMFVQILWPCCNDMYRTSAVTWLDT